MTSCLLLWKISSSKWGLLLKEKIGSKESKFFLDELTPHEMGYKNENTESCLTCIHLP